MVEPLSTAAIGAVLSSVAGSIGSAIQGARAAWEMLEKFTLLLIGVTVLLALTGVTTQGVPMLSLKEKSVLPDYVFGFPSCSSALGPIEGCILPSKDALFAFPNALGGLTRAFSSNTQPIQGQQADALGSFLAIATAMFNLMISIVPLSLSVIKLIISFNAFMALQSFWTQYTSLTLRRNPR